MNDAAFPSHTVSVATLPKKGFRLQLAADASQRAAIAEHAGVNAIHALTAEITLHRLRKDGVKLTGSLNAEVEQPCVVSLAPVIQTIADQVSLLFVPENSRLARPRSRGDGELVLDPLGEDVPDTFSGDRIDIWYPLIEHLILAIDPWPRAPGVEHSGEAEQPDFGENRPESPFSVLKQLKTGRSQRD
jgi:uncharacterized metal-binding protein YceD (DUF177 family)